MSVKVRLLFLFLVSTSTYAKRAELLNSTRGSLAITKHQGKLETIAAKYGKSRAAFEKLLRSDNSHLLDDKGNLYVSEEALVPNLLSNNTNVLNPDAAAIPDDLALKLHSRPGAARKILLDFTGHAVSNTYWNQNGTIETLPFDIDGIPSTFSQAELQKIKEIWLRVAEDFAPFDVDITTEDVLNEDELNGPLGGTRVIITPSSEWYGSGAGGVAYVGSFTWKNSTPAFVFSNIQLNDAKYIAETVSHEAGHTLGLFHQADFDANGFKISDYNQGKGDGDTGWAPIMGSGYYRKNTLWHNGKDPSEVVQDELSQLASLIPWLADDAPALLSASSPAVSAIQGSLNQTFKHQGFINLTGEKDILKLPVGAGPLQLTISGAVTAPNVDLKVILRSPSGTVLSQLNPPGSLPVMITLSNATAGEYSLEIIPMGYTDPVSGEVLYTNYGVLGRYYVTGSAGLYTAPNQVPVVNAGPDKTVILPTNSVSITGSASDADGSIVQKTWTQISGPNSAVLTGASSLNLTASSLILGTYVFRLKVKDNVGAVKYDDVKVIVKNNSLPTVNAGPDKTISSTVTSVTLYGSASDVDGTIATKNWIQVSGPSIATLSGINTLTLKASSLKRGTYIFRLSVTDNLGGSKSDEVSVIKN